MDSLDVIDLLDKYNVTKEEEAILVNRLPAIPPRELIGNPEKVKAFILKILETIRNK